MVDRSFVIVQKDILPVALSMFDVRAPALTYSNRRSRDLHLFIVIQYVTLQFCFPAISALTVAPILMVGHDDLVRDLPDPQARRQKHILKAS